MGRPQFSIQRSRGDPKPVAVSKRTPPKPADHTQSDSVAAGNTETVEIYAPSGSIYEVNNLKTQAPAPGSATTGDHQISMKSQGVPRLFGKANYNSALKFEYYQWELADQRGEPPSGTPSVTAVTDAWADENNPITFIYQNNTDASNSNDRMYALAIKEVEA